MDGHWRAARPNAFQVLHPDDIPDIRTLHTATPFELVESIGSMAQLESCTNIDVACALERTLARFPVTTAVDATAGMDASDADHDMYFGIERISGASCRIFLRMLLGARTLLMRESEEAAVGIGCANLALIDRALNDTLSLALGLAPSAKDQVLRWRVSAARACATRRWVRGHQIFCALTQGLILALRLLRAAGSEGDEPAADRALDLAISLMRGSAAALLFTGDFSPEDYRNLIRPSMMPPHLPESFSGLLSVDHRRFIQSLRDCGPALDALLLRDPDAHARLAAGISAVYDNHRFVCDRFVSGERSLRMAPGSAVSAGEQIERFKALRLRAFQVRPQSAPRIQADLTELS